MQEKHLSITQWAEEDRPREKLMQRGRAALTDAELLAILIGSGSRDETAVALSRRILRSAHDNLDELGRFSIDELIRNFKGVGEAKAISIAAALELGRRRKHAESLERKKIRTSRDIFDLFHPLLGDLQHEEVWLLLLNHTHKVLEQVRVSAGGTAIVSVDVRMTLKIALEKSALSVVLCHNHPSGNIEPSQHDKLLTDKLRQGLRAIQITLIDHIIIGHNNYYSFADSGEV
ncbi:MAG: DNA repair protein RadC [Prevotellaceae bacterium]|jgi:DNA repair protein RadC|nr:DNA repair protein RadC [Prevotellaceae bacterium]